MHDDQASDHVPDPAEAADVGAGPDCADALRELYGFLDGELTVERRHVIRRHLDDCNPCLEAFDFEAELKLVIQARCRDEVPPGLRDRVARALHDLGPGSAPGGNDRAG